MTALAIATATAAACVFGTAAVVQHGAVRATVTDERRRLLVGEVGALVRHRRWLLGLALLVVGTVLHITALTLAPISLTQPLNVLAVPTAIVVTAVTMRRRPTRAEIVGGIGVIGGVALFVSSMSYASTGAAPTPSRLGVAAAAVAVCTLACHLAARHLTRGPGHDGRPLGPGVPGWLAPVLLGLAGALNYAVTSSTYRLLAQELSGPRTLGVAVTAVLIASVPLTLATGSWSIQQAYAAGAAPAVTATSALADPLVAVLIGITLLGETPRLSPFGLLTLAAGALLAAAAVIVLARLEGETGLPGPAPPPAARPSVDISTG